MIALAGVTACSLFTDLGELTSGGEPATASEAGPSDSSAAADAAAATDAAPTDATTPCDAASNVTFQAALTSTLGPFVRRTSGVADYPKVASFFGSPATVLYPFVDPSPIDAGPDAAPTYLPQFTSAHSGMWLPNAVPLADFDVTLEAQIRCTSQSSCADGLILAWLDTTDLARLDQGADGHAAGLPPATAGAGVVLDNYRNTAPEPPDPPPPTIQIIQLDATKTIGRYPWTIASRSASFLGGWHEIAVSVRKGAVSVRFDGADWVSGLTAPVERGLFGITAGTGGETDAVAVRRFDAVFGSCRP